MVKNYVLHMIALKQALNHDIILQKVHRVIQLNQKLWLEPYIKMNTELNKKKQKMNLRKISSN